MVAWGTLGLKSAFKMLCRAMEIDVDTANEVSKLITTYEFDKKHNEHAKIEDYISNPKHLELIAYSKKYMGIIDNMSAHPCATILSNEDIRRKFGVLKSPNGVMVANVTGKQAEKLGYLKNDFLIVDVVDLNDKLYKRVGMEFVGANELYKLVEQNPELWNLFANGYTLCLNQMESSATTAKMMRYKPSNLWELSNSISAIRPSSASIYAKYEKREHFDYGIPFIDNLLQGEFIDNSFMIYQEQQMILLATIGIKPDKIVSVIKAISKKEKAVIDSISEEFHKKLFDLCIKHGETDEAKVTSVVGQLWTVFVDSAEYGFNAPHAQATATDCLHSALIKHLFPIEFYEVALEKYSSDKKTEKVALLKNEAFRYKGILVTPMRYGQNNTKFTANNDKNEIWQSLMGVKALNNNTAETIYQISKEFKDIEFFDLYIEMKSRGLSKTHIENLIKIGYFNNFQQTKREMLWLTSNYDDFNKKQINKDKVDELYGKINSDSITILDFYKQLKSLSIKETAKLLKFEEGVLAKFVFGFVKVDTQDKLEELFWECQLLGTTVDDLEEEFMLGRIIKYNPSKNSILFKHIRGNGDRWLKIKPTLNVKEKDFIFISSISAYTYRGREYYTVEECINLTETYK